MSPRKQTSYEVFYALIRRIPRGKVASYGQIAALAGLPGAARQVGYALHALPGDGNIPWHRVVNAAGRISLRTTSDHHHEQRVLLEKEGVVFDRSGRIAWERFRWQPRVR